MNRKKINKLLSSTISVIYLANSSPVFALDSQTKEDTLLSNETLNTENNTENNTINTPEPSIENIEINEPSLDKETITEEIEDSENIEETEDIEIEESQNSFNDKEENITIIQESKKTIEDLEINENVDRNSKISIQNIEATTTIYTPTVSYSNGYVTVKDNGVLSTMLNITEKFNNPNSTAFEFSNKDWTIASGVMSSKQISDYQNTKNTIVLNLDIDAELTIKAKVSSEPTYDYGTIDVNGVNIFKQSGTNNLNYTTITHTLKKGINTIDFTYKKDSSGTTGLDAMFIDEIKVSSETFQPNSERLEYRINGGQWETYLAPFECEEGALIECRSVYNSSYSDIVSTNLNIATISDANLHQTLKDILNKDENNNTILIDELKSLSGSLDLSNKNITDLSGLEHATNITELTLNNNPISDISVIENMPNLESLIAQNTNITDITSILNATSLRTIDLASDITYTETDLENIAAMPNLLNLTAKFDAPNTILNIGTDYFAKAEYLNVIGSNFKEVNIIENTDLAIFYCNSSKLGSFKALNCSSLTTVSLNYSELDNLIIDNMDSLSFLYTSESTIDNISVTNCSNFQNLFSNKLNANSLLLENLNTNAWMSLTIDYSTINNVIINDITSANSSFNSSYVFIKNLTMKRNSFENGNFIKAEIDNVNVTENYKINNISFNDVKSKNIIDFTGMNFTNMYGDGIVAPSVIISNSPNAQYISLDKLVCENVEVNNCPKATIVTFSYAKIDNISVKNMDSITTIYTRDMDCINFNVENCISMVGMYNTPNARIKNLRFINIPNLSGRDLSECNIETIVMENCNSFDNLNISSNNIKDISGISSLTALPALDISNNHITDISPLKNITSLTPENISASNQTIVLDDIISKAGTVSITAPTVIDYNGDILSGVVKSDLPSKTKIIDDLILGEFEEGIFDINIEFTSDLVDYSLIASQRITVDGTAPSINLTQDNTDWTKGSVLITVDATDTISGVDYIKLPNGDIINDTTFEFEATQNGDYEFEVADLVGNISKKTITISNIDTVAPVVNTSVTYNDDNTEAILTIEATDSLSGILNITLPDGQIVKTDTTSFIITKNGDYTIEAMDLVGNISRETIKVDAIKDKPISDDSINNDIPNNSPTDDVTNSNTSNNNTSDNNSNYENNLDKLPNSSSLGIFAPIVAMMSLAIGALSFKKKE